VQRHYFTHEETLNTRFLIDMILLLKKVGYPAINNLKFYRLNCSDSGELFVDLISLQRSKNAKFYHSSCSKCITMENQMQCPMARFLEVDL
jgi:hypothetical protein